MPVAPARLTWRIENLGGKVIVKEQIGVDFRETIPDNRLFWKYYARGTYQNCCVFGPHYSFRQPGCFLFKLTREPFDTKTIPDGVYELVVTATRHPRQRGLAPPALHRPQPPRLGGLVTDGGSGAPATSCTGGTSAALDPRTRSRWTSTPAAGSTPRSLRTIPQTVGALLAEHLAR